MFLDFILSDKFDGFIPLIEHKLMQDSKDTWNSIDAPLQKEILNYFVNNRVFSSEFFP
jgi:hypothetical protein